MVGLDVFVCHTHLFEPVDGLAQVGVDVGLRRGDVRGGLLDPEGDHRPIRRHGNRAAAVHGDDGDVLRQGGQAQKHQNRQQRGSRSLHLFSSKTSSMDTRPASASTSQAASNVPSTS